MKNIFNIFFIIQCSVFAVVRPTIPPLGEDRVLTGGLPAIEYFKNKNQNPTCAAELKTSQQKYAQFRKELNELINSHAESTLIDNKETQLQKERKTLVAKTDLCGFCSVQEIKTVQIHTPEKTEFWAVGDGSCQMSGFDRQDLSEIYERSKNTLLNTKKYPQYLGGLSYVLEFQPIDEKTGASLPHVEKPETSPFFSYLAMKGPVTPLGLVGFGYTIRCDFGETKTEELNEFFVKFNYIPSPETFKIPKSYELQANGKKKEATITQLASVQGLWYLNSNGYMRYYTASDFGMDVSFMKNFARNMLLDTVLQHAERSTVKP